MNTSRLSPIVLLVLALALGALAGMGGFLGWQAYSDSRPEIRPEFSLPDLHDRQRSITEWDGKVIVLNFWASWCPPCIHEIPMFMDLQEDYADDGLQFVGVAMDRQEDAKRFFDELEMNYPSMHGIHQVTRVGELYGNTMGTLPYTVIINRDGHIVERFNREVEREQLEPAILPHL